MTTRARDWLAIDTETTGTDPETARIVEMACVRLRPDGTRSTWCRRYNPGVPIPPVATAIHGITDADVADCEPFAAHAQELALELADVVLVGHNALGYDVPVISAEMRRAGVVWPGPDVEVIDTLAIMRAQEPHTLAGALRFYCCRPLAQAHSAAADAEATLAVALEQAEVYQVSTVAELQALGRGPDWVDAQGRLRRVGELVVLSFGKHAGLPLGEVPRDYLVWMLGASFSAEVKAAVEAELVEGPGP